MSNGWRPASAGVMVGLGIAFLAGLAVVFLGVSSERMLGDDPLEVEAGVEAEVETGMETPVEAEPPPPPPPPPGPPPGQPSLTLLMPSFPWPPPQASAVAQLTEETMDIAPRPRTLGEVDARLRMGLEGAGYAERSYYAVPGGFALVTRLEQIEEDGRPKAGSDRWAPDPGPLRPFTLRGYLRALLGANPGYFRILVLVVTPERFYQDETTVTREEAQRWLTSGFNDLPAEMARLPVDDQIRVTGLIYEFQIPTVGEAADIAIPGRLTGPDHIQRSGILDHLRR